MKHELTYYLEMNFSRDEAARLTGVNPKTIPAWAARGFLHVDRDSARPKGKSGRGPSLRYSFFNLFQLALLKIFVDENGMHPAAVKFLFYNHPEWRKENILRASPDDVRVDFKKDDSVIRTTESVLPSGVARSEPDPRWLVRIEISVLRVREMICEKIDGLKR
jgi:hypothetical protein